MSDPQVVDVHVHLFERPDDPLRDGYDIWEYGAHDGVAFGTPSVRRMIGASALPTRTFASIHSPPVHSV